MIKHFEFSEGTIKSCKSLTPRGNNFAVLGAKCLQKGVKIPNLKKERFPMRALICERDIENCYQTFSKLIDSVCLEYF